MKKISNFLVTVSLIIMIVCATRCNNNNSNIMDVPNTETQIKDNMIGGHEYVDLGLPSGTLWATCNVGAEKPEEFGNYFAWGEIKPKFRYCYETYKHCFYDSSRGISVMDHVQFTKYTETTNRNNLLPDDDAAIMNWGNDWRMPTLDEFEELDRYCRIQVVVRNDVKGHLYIARNGTMLFLPAAGCRTYDTVLYKNDGGYYWSASLPRWIDGGNSYDFGGCNDLEIDDPCDGLEGRDIGRTIRPVYSNSNLRHISGTISHKNISVDRLSEEDLDMLSAKELTYLRNKAYAIHGYVFKSQELNDYFKQFEWYHPNPSVTVSVLNSTEKANAEFIKRYQEENGKMYKPH